MNIVVETMAIYCNKNHVDAKEGHVSGFGSLGPTRHCGSWRLF